ncbi:hypothetical protein F5J12DRAFT_784213 [Pisolithus orientalis]|uniref:uncharacterized protein n=1 Tax=Pisolithus orientalis TaxID=936130 RepID=UPI002225643E|nr:uncharacterized protein F5J12DRAFT_784213 [Pisolithus orientalis]KAI6000964.1 hypothetical protein F5J12DRAFT_784213 [Pisolithus orientalis]
MSTANTSTFIPAQLTDNIQPVITTENAKWMVKEAARVTMQALRGLWGQDTKHWGKAAQLGMVHMAVEHLPPAFEIPLHLIAINMHMVMEELTRPSSRAKHQAQPVDKGKGKELGTDATDPPITPAPTTTTGADDPCLCDKYWEEVTILKQENADMRWEIEVTCTELAAFHWVVDAIHNHLFQAPDMLNHPLVPFHATSNPTLVPHMPVMVELGTATGVVEVQSSQSSSRQESTEPPLASFKGGASLEVPPSNVEAVHGPAGGLAISITPPPPAVRSVPRQEDTGKPIWYGDVCTKAVVLQALRANGVMVHLDD